MTRIAITTVLLAAMWAAAPARAGTAAQVIPATYASRQVSTALVDADDWGISGQFYYGPGTGYYYQPYGGYYYGPPSYYYVQPPNSYYYVYPTPRYYVYRPHGYYWRSHDRDWDRWYGHHEGREHHHR